MVTDQNAPNSTPDPNSTQEPLKHQQNTNDSASKSVTTENTTHPHDAKQQQPVKERRHFRRKSKNWVRDRDVLYEKAIKLAQSGRVEFLDNGIYNVIGDHGTYTVALNHEGKLSCNCLGFIQKGICSHITAVSLITRKRRHH
jgi:hypothetical protein